MVTEVGCTSHAAVRPRRGSALLDGHPRHRAHKRLVHLHAVQKVVASERTACGDAPRTSGNGRLRAAR
eukprot:3316620-Prymnesium_polylepis.1